MIEEEGLSTQGWSGNKIGELKKCLSQLVLLEEQLAHQTKTTLLTNLTTRNLICDQALTLAADISLAACTAAWQGSVIIPMISRSLVKGLFLGLRETGQDLYASAYLTMRSLMIGAVCGGAEPYPIAREGSQVILALTEEIGADKELIIKKLAEGALEADYSCPADERAVEKLFLELFEQIDHVTSSKH
jgi:hypothetical protein